VSVARYDAAEPYITNFWPGNTNSAVVTRATFGLEPPVTSLLTHAIRNGRRPPPSKYTGHTCTGFLELRSICDEICINLFA